MNTYLALFRGINVGGKNILPMKELIAILGAMGFENIRTYIQSGNVVFQSKKKLNEKSASEISKQVRDKKGFEPKLLLLGAEELQNTIANNPFSTGDGKTLHFFFLESPPRQPNTERLMALKADSEEFKLDDKVFYLYAPEGIGRSKLAAGVEKTLDVPVTARNCNTVAKLISMIEEAEKAN